MLHREYVDRKIDYRDAQDVAGHVPDHRLVVWGDLRLAHFQIVVEVVRVVAGGIGALVDLEGPVGVERDELAVEESFLVLGAALPDLPFPCIHVVLHAVPDHDVHIVLQPGIGIGLGIDVRRGGQEVRGQQIGVGVEQEPTGRQLDVAVRQLGAPDKRHRGIGKYVLDAIRVVIQRRQAGRIGLGAGPARPAAAAGWELREGRPGEAEEQQAE